MKGASFGGFVQRGELSVIDPDEAFLVFGKWVEDGTRLRLDTELPACHFSCEGTLESAVFPMVRLRLDSLGFIEIHLPDSTAFDYCDPDSMRVDLADRIGQRHTGEPVCQGAVVCAVGQSGEKFLFVEVVAES